MTDGRGFTILTDTIQVTSFSFLRFLFLSCLLAQFSPSLRCRIISALRVTLLYFSAKDAQLSNVTARFLQILFGAVDVAGQHRKSRRVQGAQILISLNVASRDGSQE